MWAFLVVSVLAWGIAEIFYKKGNLEREKYSHLKTTVYVGLFMGVYALIILFTQGVDLKAFPHNFVRYLPVAACYIFSMILSYFGVRFLEESISDPIEKAKYINLTYNDVTDWFLFSDFTDFVEVDEFNSLRFEKLRFQHHIVGRYGYGLAYISFKDTYNLFPALKEDDKGDKIVYLAIVDDGDGYGHFAFRDYLYYSNFYLTIDPSKRGYKAKKLFIPRGYEELFSEYKLHFYAGNICSNATQFECEFEVQNTKYCLSNDPNSRYGIVGGIRK